MAQMRHSSVLRPQRFLAYKWITEDSRALKQALVEKPLFSILHRTNYLDLRLALSPIQFPVEVSLHDDTAWRQLPCGILSEPLCPVGRLDMFESTQCVRIGEW